MNRVEDGKWVGQDFTTHYKINNDGATVTRVVFLVKEKQFTFAGKNPLKLPKKIQRWVNEWMALVCQIEGMAVWDCEAWEGYENTHVVH